ncbi:hypothetical protein WJX82_007824 [Trebouxia sp. C0006]
MLEQFICCISVSTVTVLGWWLLQYYWASCTHCISRLDNELPVRCSLVVAAFLDCLLPFLVAWMSGLSGSRCQTGQRKQQSVI